MRGKILVILVFAATFLSSSCSENKKITTDVNLNPSATYTVTISPSPSLIEFGAYGTLFAAVKNNLTHESVENPEIQWSSTWSGASFSSQNSSTTVFTAPLSGTGSMLWGITADYKGTKGTISFLGGNVEGNGMWMNGNNDNNFPSYYSITIVNQSDLIVNQNVVFRADVYGFGGALDSSADCSSAAWIFSPSNVFTLVTPALGKTVTLKITRVPNAGEKFTIKVKLRGVIGTLNIGS